MALTELERSEYTPIISFELHKEKLIKVYYTDGNILVGPTVIKLNNSKEDSNFKFTTTQVTFIDPDHKEVIWNNVLTTLPVDLKTLQEFEKEILYFYKDLHKQICAKYKLNENPPHFGPIKFSNLKIRDLQELPKEY